MADPDLWLHLRSGEWIVQHGAVPQTDPFSVFGSGRPWAAYSWLFELSVLQLFQRLGLVGIVAYSCGMVLAITVALHHLIRRLQPDFHIALLLTLVAGAGMAGAFTPRPWLFSILFFVLELDILMHALHTGRVRELAWLPVIFALWANLHIQFIDGLVLLGIALLTSRTRVAMRYLGAALVASVVATLVNPYGWHIYQVAWALVTQSGIMHMVSELQAMAFRSVSDFCILFLALAAAAALGRWRRFPPFETGALAFAAIVAFRSQRDGWVMAAIASAILAAAFVVHEPTPYRLPSIATGALALAAGLVLLFGFRFMHLSNDRLQIQLAKNMPIRAVEFVKSMGYRGPLFNDFNWGGYLIWALRLPVSMDGRTSVYGDERISRSLSTWNAEPDWAANPQLRAAKLVIGSIKSPLTQVLRMDQRFALAYEDPLAAVFVARPAPLQPVATAVLP